MAEHWTRRSIEDLRYSVATDFLLQIEKRMERDGVRRVDLADRLGVERSYVTQIFNSPPNLSLDTAIRLAHAVGLEVSLVAYDDGQAKEHGPIHSEIFRLCWEDKKRPRDFFGWARRRIENLR